MPPTGRQDTHWLQHGDVVVLFTMDRVPFTVSPLDTDANGHFQLRPDETVPYREEEYVFNTQGE